MNPCEFYRGQFCSRCVHGNLELLDANAALAGNQAFSFIGTSEFSNEGQVRAFATNFGQLIQFNTTGDSVAEFEIFVETPLSISASDFFL